MAGEPAEDYLRSDRIYDYDEFREVQARYGGRAVRSSRLLDFEIRKQRRFEFVLNYHKMLRIGIALLVLTVAAYGLLSTGILRKNFALEQKRKSLHNLSLNLEQQALANTKQREQLIHNQAAAAALGLTPLVKPTYIVRTNIPPRKPEARTVDELYPLSHRLLTIEP